jgi:hypothetical protein
MYNIRKSLRCSIVSIHNIAMVSEKLVLDRFEGFQSLEISDADVQRTARTWDSHGRVSSVRFSSNLASPGLPQYPTREDLYCLLAVPTARTADPLCDIHCFSILPLVHRDIPISEAEHLHLSEH